MLVKEELERYSRQILLYGKHGQELLKNSHVLVVGAGGLGSTVLPIIAAAGIGKLSVFDADRVERSNLARQLLFREKDIGSPKAEIAAKFLRELNPHIEIIGVERNLGADDRTALEGADLIIEGSDSLTTKFTINALAMFLGRPAIIAALGKTQGHALLLAGAQSACYRCLFEQANAAELPTCASEGILSSFPAWVGASVAQIGLAFLLREQREPGLWLFEKNNCRKVKVNKRSDCEMHHHE